jgi:hypothetical protein
MRVNKLRCFLAGLAAALSGVDLIQGASWAIVLSDILTAAFAWAGKLWQVILGPMDTDRDPGEAVRPPSTLAGRKFFVAAQLFTVGCGELVLRALLAAG